MEFLEGESLRQALTRRGALPLPEVAEILQQAARGLNAAHKLGIIHRDLKPDNIFLTRGDEGETIVKVVDFGIAKLRESATHTQTGMVLGTPAYMSFEQASGMRSDELDARSDVYSLGVVAYEMLTGRAPFHSDTPVGYLRMHMQEDPPPFRAVKPDLPALPQLEGVVMKALTKDREQRYGSVLEFARELISAAQPSPTAQSPATIPPTRIVPPSAVTKPQRLPGVTENPSRVRFTVLGLVLLAVIAGGIWYFSRLAGQAPAHVTGPPSGATVPAGQKPRAEQAPAHVTSPSSGATVPAGQKPRAEAPLAELGPTPGKVRVNLKDGLKYVWILPGTFQMGCSPGDSQCGHEEKPPHLVSITRGFWLGQTEVTVGAYKRFAEDVGKAMPNGGFPPGLGTTPDFNPGWSNERMPVVNVSWDDAQAYCAWAGGRLPTEAEWEYAARAGNTAARYVDLDETAWYADNSGGQRLDITRIFFEDLDKYAKRLKENGNRTHEVGQKRANGFRLYDVLGNVWEWVNDWYDEDYYQRSPSQDPAGPTSGQYRVLRGGSWRSVPMSVRVSSRFRLDPASGYGDDFGFRCAREVDIP
jgi:formylglycine-generating enzyme required for sulfatase activity